MTTVAERLDLLEAQVAQLTANETRILNLTERVVTVLATLTDAVIRLDDGQKRLERQMKQVDIFTRGIAAKLLSPAEIRQIEAQIEELQEAPAA